MTNSVQLGAQTNAWTINPKEIETLYLVLNRIRELGLKGFETSYRNLESAANNGSSIPLRLQAIGLTFFGVHIFLPDYDETTRTAPLSLYTKVADTVSPLNARHLILSGSPCRSLKALANKVDGLNRAGEVASRRGMMVAYHNHSPELQNSGHEMHHLIENTDSKLVGFVIDAGHAFQAGVDVPAFLATHARRIVGVHLRDSKRRTEVSLGNGHFPLQATVDALRRADWHGWALLEEERADGSKLGDSAIVPALSKLQQAFSTN